MTPPMIPTMAVVFEDVAVLRENAEEPLEDEDEVDNGGFNLLSENRIGKPEGSGVTSIGGRGTISSTEANSDSSTAPPSAAS
jgi:hypothetical protein